MEDDGSSALSLLSGDDPVTHKAPLQLQVLQLLPQLLTLLLLLLLPGIAACRDTMSRQTTAEDTRQVNMSGQRTWN